MAWVTTRRAGRFAPRVAAPVAAVALAGCAALAPVPPAAPVWPPPPAEARLVYEGTLRSAASLQAPSAAAALERWAGGRPAQSSTPLLKPYDIAAHNGLIVVSDTLAGVVHVFDVPRRRVFAIGFRGAERLFKPLGLALGRDDDIYVADAEARRVLVFDAYGHPRRPIAAEDWVRPSDVAVDAAADRLYVLDTGGIESDHHCVYIYDLAGKRLAVLGRRGSAPGEFNLPNQIAVGPGGLIYVLDAGNFRVQVFDSAGQFQRAFGAVGTALGNLARPRGLAVDGLGRVYVSDAAFQNVQIFDTEGRLLLPVGTAGGSDLPGHYGLPAGVAVDETGRVYVVDQVFRKIEVLRLLDAQ